MTATPEQFQLDRWQQGDPLTARQLNQAVEAIRRLTRGVTPPQQITPRADAAGGGIQMALFQIYGVGDDVLFCYTYDGTTADTTQQIVIGKVWTLRRSLASRNSLTYAYSTAQARVATGAAGTESQVVTPAFVVGDVIQAVKLSLKAGLQYNSKAVEWFDMNVDARQWAKVAS